jgi:hypothetical protein
MFRAYLVLGLIWIGLGIVELVRGGLGFFGLAYVAFGIAWFVFALLRRKGILPERRRPRRRIRTKKICLTNAPFGPFRLRPEWDQYSSPVGG